MEPMAHHSNGARARRHRAISRAWGPGTEFEVEETGDGILLRPAAHFPDTDLEAVAGCLRSRRKSKTPAQMRVAMVREVMRRHDRGRY
jgi:hypothetical protein